MISQGLRASSWSLIVFVCALGFAPLAGAFQAGGIEEFDEQDPYTKEDPAAMKALGYVRYEPFTWQGADRTEDVQQKLGGTPMLFLETDHFVIASSLGTYTIGRDPIERDKLKAELKRLGKKWRKLRLRGKKIDPWLRLHLYAQRAEELYQQFHELYGLEPADYEKLGPYLGMPNKPMLLLAQRSSEFSRYLKVYVEQEGEGHFRWAWDRNRCFFGLDAETIQKGFGEAEAVDTRLHCLMATSLGAIFVDTVRQNQYSAPVWLTFGTGHLLSRRVDERFPTQFGRTRGISADDKESFLWGERVQNFLKNDFFAPMDEMTQWLKYPEMKERDHLVAWSKLQFLTEEEPEAARDFLLQVAIPNFEKDEDKRRAALSTLQVKALQSALDCDLAKFDDKWKRWARRRYR